MRVLDIVFGQIIWLIYDILYAYYNLISSSPGSQCELP